MYQSVLRDPGGAELVRILPNICGEYSAIVNGSVLLVPPGTTAVVDINGTLRAYGPGKYELFTGVDPFFVRLRNALTHGDAGISVSVFFVSTEKIKFTRLGTGELLFHANRFGLTMKALASCNLSYSISDPILFLKKLVGSYSCGFDEDSIAPCIEQIVLTPIREELSRAISQLDVVQFNSSLSRIGNMAAPGIRTGLSEYGIRLQRFDLTGITVPHSEIQRLYSLEEEYASGRTRTDLELDHLQRVWNGSVANRTVAEMMTGFPSRGQAPSGGAADNHGGAPMMQMMMYLQMAQALSVPLSDLTRQAGDLFAGASPESPSSADTASPTSDPERD